MLMCFVLFCFFVNVPARAVKEIINYSTSQLQSCMNDLSRLLYRTAAEAMVMNPPEPVKEKEKQGFFRAIKKKKKKTQIVRSLKQSYSFPHL